MEGYGSNSPRWRSPGDGRSPRFRGRSSYRGDNFRFPNQNSPRYRHDMSGNPYRSPHGGSPYNYRGFEPRGYHGYGNERFQRHHSPGFSPGGRYRGRGHGRKTFESAGIDSWISPEMWEDPWAPLKSKQEPAVPTLTDISDIAQKPDVGDVLYSAEIPESSEPQPQGSCSQDSDSNDIVKEDGDDSAKPSTSSPTTVETEMESSGG